ncbi:MAG TPA: hypothetical protein V6C95_13025 [Coleofasciculaceae cyanobacterium]
MNKRLLLASTTLLLITGFGQDWGTFIRANSLSKPVLAHESAGGSSQGSMMSGEGMHEHKTMEIPSGQPIPSVDLIVHPDAMGGWNIEAKISNFRFAPDKINQDSNPQEGHAHLYVNGKKLTRLYGSWYYLSNLTPGSYNITVTLNTNRHEDLIYNGQVIGDTETIDVPEMNQ